MKKRTLLWGLTALLLIAQPTFVSCLDGDEDVASQVELTGFDMLDADINRLINEDQKLIAERGYGNLVIPRRLNKISSKVFPEDALWVCQQLANAGYDAYIVGGSVRDLLMGKDAATPSIIAPSAET